jgi:hypothetical protein
MRPTTVIGLFGLVILGGIVADVWAHPQGTAAAGNGLANLWTPSLQTVSGQTVTSNLAKQ